jgi:hypothetical protein
VPFGARLMDTDDEIKKLLRDIRDAELEHGASIGG